MKTKVTCFRINKNISIELENLWMDLLDMFSGDKNKMMIITKANIVESVLSLLIEDFKLRKENSFIFLRMDFKLKTFKQEGDNGESSNKKSI